MAVPQVSSLFKVFFCLFCFLGFFWRVFPDPNQGAKERRKALNAVQIVNANCYFLAEYIKLALGLLL